MRYLHNFSISVLAYLNYFDSSFHLIQPLVLNLSFKYFPPIKSSLSSLPLPYHIPPYPNLFLPYIIIFSPHFVTLYLLLLSLTSLFPPIPLISSPSRVLVSLIFPPFLDLCSLYFPSLLSISFISSLRLSLNSHLPSHFPFAPPYLLLLIQAIPPYLPSSSQ
jgi:hypothetical protein